MKISQYLLLLVLPVLLFISATALKDVQGPYYLNFYDPSYVYLINSLNLAQLEGYIIGHYDHPGTPVQMAGAVIIKCYHFFFGGTSDITASVLSDPERYLFVINRIFILLNSLTLLGLGIFTFFITKNISFSLLIQLSPLGSLEVFYGLMIVTPENFLIFSSLILIGILIWYLYRIDPREKIPILFTLVAGLVCGFALANKLNFAPMLLIPFIIIPGLKNKIIFSGISLVAFMIFTVPIFMHYDQFAGWIQRLFISSGQYGKGESTIINASTFTDNLVMIFTKGRVFRLAYPFTFLTIVTFYLLRPKDITGIYYKKVLLLKAIFISMTLQILFVAKHYAQYYLIPSFILAIFACAISVSVLFYLFKQHSKPQRLTLVYSIIIFLILSWGTYRILFSYYEGEMQCSEAKKIVEYIKNNYPDNYVISSFGSADKECALVFGTLYAAEKKSQYQKFLNNNGKGGVFFDPWASTLYSTIGNVKDKGSLPINNSKKIILQINSYGSVDKFVKQLESIGFKVASVKKVYTNENMESVYEIYLN